MKRRRKQAVDLSTPPPAQQWTIGKVFTFDAAHQLPLHDGKCRNLHGHTYRVEVRATGSLIDTGAKSGMVVDFGDIKAVWDELLKPKLDHQFLNETLPVPHTTAEHIAGWILEQLRTHFSLPLQVTVWETPDSWARTP